jgi:hypothetical protein
MPRKCLVCESEELKAIDTALVDNEPIRKIASRFGFSTAGVQRHRLNHLPKLLLKAREAKEIVHAASLVDRAKAKDAEEIVHASSLMNRVERVMARCEMIAETATKAGDWTPAISASRELRGCLELLGKLSGEIQTGAKIGIAVNAPGSSAIPLQSMTTEELKAYLLAHGHPVLDQQLTLTEGNTP